MNAAVVCVVLAAGRSRRMGFDKLAHWVGEAPIISRSLTNLVPLSVVVVISPALVDVIKDMSSFVMPVVNAFPERGMTYSLKLAMPYVAADTAFAVCLADVPLVTSKDVLRLERARAAAAVDVAFPVRRSQPGHPVIFGPHARGFVGSLPDGDTLRQLRDEPRLTRLRIDDERQEPYLDVDTPDDIEQYTGHVIDVTPKTRGSNTLESFRRNDTSRPATIAAMRQNAVDASLAQDEPTHWAVNHATAEYPSISDNFDTT